MISRVCEEFHVTPAQAEGLLDDDGERVLEIISLRAYKRAFDAYQNLDALDKKSRDKVTADPIVRVVLENDKALVKGLVQDDDGEPDAG